jgi:iron-sulfur cluster assembly protein
MIEAGEEAIKKIKQFLNEQEKPQPIRVLMTQGGWKGPYLVMALDDQKENDLVFAQQGVTFLIDKGLLDEAKSVKIDYVHSPLGSGYTLKSNLLKETLEECETPLCQTCYPHG